MSYTEYSTHDMLQMLRIMREPDPFFLRTFFPNQINFTDEWIDFDRVDETRRLAPFVAPTAQGKVIRDEGYTTKRFRPAYVKPKFVIDPSKLIARRAGEAYNGTMSLAQRRDAIIADQLRKGRNQIIRRWEWMAAQATLYGQVTVSGENYPTVVVNFGRDNALTATLTGTDAWSNAAATPQTDLEDMVKKMRELSGYAVEDIIMGPTAWYHYSRHQSTKDLISTQARASSSNIETGPGTGSPFTYKGQVGELKIWVYSDKYENDSGVLTDYMDPRDVIGVATAGFQGHRCFGAILDKKAGFQALDIFSKTYEQEDPSVEYLLMQSAPLMVPKDPNASFRIRAVE